MKILMLITAAAALAGLVLAYNTIAVAAGAALLAAAVGFLEKPYDMIELSAAVRKALSSI